MTIPTEDWVAIVRLQTIYRHLLDDLRMDEWGELFCEDAVWSAGPDIRFEGRSNIVIGVRALEPKLPGMVRHLAFSPVIDLAGDHAYCWSDAIAIRAEQKSIVAVGRYHDVVRRSEGGWRFAQRVFVHSGDPVPDDVRLSPSI